MTGIINFFILWNLSSGHCYHQLSFILVTAFCLSNSKNRTFPKPIQVTCCSSYLECLLLSWSTTNHSRPTTILSPVKSSTIYFSFFCVSIPRSYFYTIIYWFYYSYPCIHPYSWTRPCSAPGTQHTFGKYFLLWWNDYYFIITTHIHMCIWSTYNSSNELTDMVFSEYQDTQRP